MGLFDFFRFPNCNRFPDSYAIDRRSLYLNLQQTLEYQRSLPKTIIISAHFPETFFALQDLLSDWSIEYQIIPRPLDENWFLDHRSSASDQVFLSLAEFLSATDFPPKLDWTTPLALLMLDRHPLAIKDETVEHFAESFPAKSELGYFLSFEDEIIDRAIDKRMLDLIIQMGAESHGLIASSMLSRRLKKVLARQAHAFVASERSAESVEQWYDLNIASPGTNEI